MTSLKSDPHLECQTSYGISSYTWFTESYLWVLNVCYTMDGWSSNNDSYHFGVGCTSIMLRKRCRYAPVRNACWFQYHSLRDHIWKHNLLRLWCPSYNNNYVKGTGKVSNVFTFFAYQFCDKRPCLGKYQYQITARWSFILPLG